MRKAALALLLLAASPAAASTDLGGLLADLGLASPEGRVAIEARRDKGGDVLITLTPQGATRLVADPGIVATPLGADGKASGPAVEQKGASEYFLAPPTLAVPPGHAPQIQVEYAYCVVERQCLFGETLVRVPPEG